LQNGGGSGLGLFIANKIVELHEGTLSVHSEGEGKGSTFSMTLPIVFKSDAIVPTKMSSFSISSMQPKIGGGFEKGSAALSISLKESSLLLSESKVTDDSLPNKKVVTILIVDDSTMNRKMISRMFSSSEEFEYNLLDAADGQEGVDAVLGGSLGYRMSEIDVVLMDNQMPVMNGITAVKLLREGGFKNLIVMISGDSMHSDSVSMGTCGADRVLLKPIRKDALLEMIRTFIHGK